MAKLNVKLLNNIVYYNDEILNPANDELGIVNSKTRLAFGPVGAFNDLLNSSFPDISLDIFLPEQNEEVEMYTVANNVVNKKDPLPFENKEEWVWKTMLPGEEEGMETRGIFVKPLSAPDSVFIEIYYNQETEINVENNVHYYAQLLSNDTNTYFESDPAPYCTKALLVIWDSGHRIVFNAWVPGTINRTQPF